jgi:hypothetical protein
MQRRLLDAAGREKRWTAVGDTDPAHGARITRYNGARIVWHGGGWKGITGHFGMYPELGYTSSCCATSTTTPP